jgi:hypothetical protein
LALVTTSSGSPGEISGAGLDVLGDAKAACIFRQLIICSRSALVWNESTLYPRVLSCSVCPEFCASPVLCSKDGLARLHHGWSWWVVGGSSDCWAQAQKEPRVEHCELTGLKPRVVLGLTHRVSPSRKSRHVYLAFAPTPEALLRRRAAL